MPSKLLKTFYKKKKLKIGKNETLPIKEKQFLMTSYFLSGNIDARRKGHNIFKCLKKTANCKSHIWQKY